MNIRKRIDYVRRRLWKLRFRANRGEIKWDIWTAVTRPGSWFDVTLYEAAPHAGHSKQSREAVWAIARRLRERGIDTARYRIKED